MEKDNKMTMSTICENWLDYIHLHVKYSTYVQYERIVHTHINHFFGNLKIGEVTFLSLQEFIQYLATNGNHKRQCGLSPKTINDILIVLKAIFKYGSMVDREICSSLPQVQLLRVQHEPVKVFNQCEFKVLENYLTETPTLSKLGILICMYSGLRIGEVCALQWNNIDFDRELLCITQTAYRTKNPEFNPDSDLLSSSNKTKIIVSSPKTWNSVRKVPIASKLIELLKKFSSHYSKKCFVLTGSGSPMDPRTYQYQYKQHLQACKIPYLNFHCLRHTFSTRCIENGCDIKSLSEMLGHASTSITLQKYVFSSYHQKKQFVDLL